MTPDYDNTRVLLCQVDITNSSIPLLDVSFLLSKPKSCASKFSYRKFRPEKK